MKFIEQYKKIILIIIVVIGVFLRFYMLGMNPPSLTWDEASNGYNAYSLLKTGKDEYGTPFPLSIRSFDDQKPPVYAYLTIPFVWLFDLNEMSIRFLSAFCGSISILVIYFFVKTLFLKWDQKASVSISLLSAFFLAVSPWSLQFSRAAFEGNVGLLFLLLGLLFVIKGFDNKLFFIPSALSFVVSLYSYHSFRLLVPLLLGVIVWLFFKEFKKVYKFLIVIGIGFIILILPVYLSFIYSSSGTGARLSMVTLFSDSQVIDKSIKYLEYDKASNDVLGSLLHNRRLVFAGATIEGYLDHFNPDFLFLHGDSGVQHHAVDMGMLYLFDFPFILIGLFICFHRRNKYIYLLFALLFLAALPSAITTGTPHPVRAIVLLIPLHIFAAVGVIFTIKKIISYKKILLTIPTVSFILLLFIGNFYYYMHQYYVHTPIEYGYFWQYGYKDIVKYALDNEKNYDKIVITYKYDQPYIYYLFYNTIDPSWYQKNWDYNKTGQTQRFERKIGKYEFRNINYSSDKELPKTLLIGTPKEIPEDADILKEVLFPDGTVAFRIVST